MLTDFIALLAVMVWPVVPLFWIPVHCLTGFFRRLGYLTYLLPIITWLPFAYLIYLQRDFIVGFKLDLPTMIRVAGILFLSAGTLLHIWTGMLLGLRGLIGLPEIVPRTGGRLVAEGPFSIVRHPTYLAHTVMFFGVFLMTEVIAVGIVTLIDLLVINTMVIPLEDKELLQRFGRAYEV